MKLLIACLLAAMACVPVLAQEKEKPTIDSRIAELRAKPTVKKVRMTSQPKDVRGWGEDETYQEAQITYVVVEGDVLKDNTVAVRITEDGAHWYGGVPSVLIEPAPIEDDPLGTDKEILTAVGGVILKAEIERHPVVGDVPPSATVYGYREVEGKPVEFKVVVYSKDGSLVSNEPTDKAAASVEVAPK